MPITRQPRLTRAESRAQTRARLLEAAEAVFVARGFGAASIEEIADVAGYTKGAVYSNFPDKTALFIAVREQRLEQSIREVAASVNGRVDEVLTRLRTRAANRADAEAWAILTAEFWLFAMRNPDARQQLADHDRVLRDAYTAAIQTALTNAGVAPPAPIADLAVMLQVLDQGITNKHYLDPTEVREGLFFDAIALLLRAATALDKDAH